MRLQSAEIGSLRESITHFLQRKPAELRLYGSRVNDNLKGGDIDLLLLVNDESFRQHLLANKHHILAKIKEAIGDQKIDLTITTPAKVAEDSFMKAILEGSTLLHRWQ